MFRNIGCLATKKKKYRSRKSFWLYSGYIKIEHTRSLLSCVFFKFVKLITWVYIGHKICQHRNIQKDSRKWLYQFRIFARCAVYHAHVLNMSRPFFYLFKLFKLYHYLNLLNLGFFRNSKITGEAEIEQSIPSFNTCQIATNNNILKFISRRSSSLNWIISALEWAYFISQNSSN